MQENRDPREFTMTYQQAASLLGITYDTFKSHHADNFQKVRRVGARIYLHPFDVLEYKRIRSSGTFANAQSELANIV